MNKAEDIKKLIIKELGKSNDKDYLTAVLTFVRYYPTGCKEKE